MHALQFTAQKYTCNTTSTLKTCKLTILKFSDMCQHKQVISDTHVFYSTVAETISVGIQAYTWTSKKG